MSDYESLDVKEKQKLASKVYREKEKELQQGLQVNLMKVQEENKVLMAENNLLKQEINSYFTELGETIRELTAQVRCLECNPGQVVPIKEDSLIIDSEPIMFNPNSFFVIVMFLIVILPQIFFPASSPVIETRAQFLTPEELFPRQESISSGVQMLNYESIENTTPGQLRISYQGQNFKIEDFCKNMCKGNTE